MIDIPTSCSPAWYSSSSMDRSYNLYLFFLGFLLPLSLLLSSSAAALTAIKTVSFFRNLTILHVIWYSKVEGKFNEKTKNTILCRKLLVISKIINHGFKAVHSIQSEEIKKNAIKRQKKIIKMVCNIPIKIIRWLEGCYQSLLLLNDSSCCPRSSSWPAPSSCAGLRTRCWPWWRCWGSVSPSGKGSKIPPQ